MLTTEETEVNKRNPYLNRDEVEREYKKIFGVKKILWVPKCSYDDEDQCTDLVPGPDGTPYAYRTCAANGHMDEIPIDAFALNVLGGGIHCLTRNVPLPVKIETR